LSPVSAGFQVRHVIFVYNIWFPAYPTDGHDRTLGQR